MTDCVEDDRSSRSPPVCPSTKSFPAPGAMMSEPGPAQMRSLPPRPSMRSFSSSGEDHIWPVRADDSIVTGIADNRGALSEASLDRESLRGCNQQSHNGCHTGQRVERSGSCHWPSLPSTRFQARPTPHYVAVEVASTSILRIELGFLLSDPNGIPTRVTALKGPLGCCGCL